MINGLTPQQESIIRAELVRNKRLPFLDLALSVGLTEGGERLVKIVRDSILAAGGRIGRPRMRDIKINPHNKYKERNEGEEVISDHSAKQRTAHERMRELDERREMAGINSAAEGVG